MEQVVQKPENHLTSAAAFVEGGIQEACDDACSICLEEFSENDPSTVTVCKHEYHLQCILEWCQRSSQCPMCWQDISLKDPSSQELLDAIEHERSIRNNALRNATVFHHPTLGDLELQHIPINASDAELEERIIQHLAAAAAMGRARHIARREGHRTQSSGQRRPQFLVFSTRPNTPPGDSTLASVTNGSTSLENTGEGSSAASTPLTIVQAAEVSGSTSVLSGLSPNSHGTSLPNLSPTQPSPNGQDRAGPSEFQSFSESLKSRMNAMSTRYKESITKSTKSWKEKLFFRNTSVTDIGSEVKREVNSGIATVSRMLKNLETTESNTSNSASASNNLADGPPPDEAIQHLGEPAAISPVCENNAEASCAASSASS